MDTNKRRGPAPKKIICIQPNGTYCVFTGLKEAAAQSYISMTNIWQCCTGRLDQTGGCRWVYAENVHIQDGQLYYNDTNQPVPRPRGRYKLGRWKHGQTEPILQSDWEAELATKRQRWRPEFD